MESKNLFLGLLKALLVVIFVAGVVFVFPWGQLEWGSIKMTPERTITVSGTAESKTKNQIARFSGGVNATNDNRDTAISEVNKKIEAIINAVKDFGIDDSDIQTQSMSVYQQTDSYWEDGKQKQRPGQWSVSNNIEVILRDVDKAGRLADIMTKNGATNVYGPSFSLDTTKKAEDALVGDAVENARLKAEEIAKASGATLGRIVSVSEGSSGYSTYPVMYAMRDGMGGGGPSPVEPGSSYLSKTVTVVFSLR